MMAFLDTLRARLPVDGQGLGGPSDPALHRLRRWAAARFWRRVPTVVRPFGVALARLAWLGVIPARAVKFARRESLSVRETARLIGHCAWTGAQPNEAFVWERHFTGLHPLPGRAAGRLLPSLGDAAQARLLHDKHAAAEFLARANLATPVLHAVIPRGARDGVSRIAQCGEQSLFIKPRRGAAARGTMRVEVLPDGRFRLDGGAPAASEAVEKMLSRRTASDDVLVQEFLTAAPELADLSIGGRPPVLRLTTVRTPASAPFLYSALLSIDVPGENPGRFIRGQLRVPVDPVTGRLLEGVLFHHAGERYARLPWNGAPLAGRALPAFDAAARMARRAMALLPDLPIVNWDLILTAKGPVILEGNTGGDWILTNLAASQGLACVPLVPILEAWQAHFGR